MTGMAGELIKLTAAELAARIARGELTALEVTEAHLARIEAVDEKVNAFLHVDREGALDLADLSRQIAWYQAQGFVDRGFGLDAVLDGRFVRS